MIIALMYLISGLFMIGILAMSYPRHRIIKYETDDEVWFIPQETTFFWIFWRNMQYAISPYTDRTYKFKTYEQAKQFLASIKKSKPKITVME